MSSDRPPADHYHLNVSRNLDPEWSLVPHCPKLGLDAQGSCTRCNTNSIASNAGCRKIKHEKGKIRPAIVHVCGLSDWRCEGQPTMAQSDFYYKGIRLIKQY